VVEIDGSAARYIDADVVELIREFEASSHLRGISVHLVAIPEVGASSAARSRRGPRRSDPSRSTLIGIPRIPPTKSR